MKQQPRQPKGPKFTQDQEELLAVAERLHMRAGIFVAGVADQLKTADYCGSPDFLSECARALHDAARLREEGFLIQSQVRAGTIGPANPAANPAKKKADARRA